MAIILKSSYMEWWDSSNVWFNRVCSADFREKYLNCLKAINDAKTYLDGLDNLATIWVPITADDIEELYSDALRFRLFCDGIHYEISELVDTPFSVDMGNLAEEAIELNPSDCKYLKSKFLWIKNYLSLNDIISSTMTDQTLKTSFENLAKQLDEDTVSLDLEQAIAEAEFWQNEFELAEKVGDVTDEIFTPEVREAWPTMSEDERKKYIEEFKNKLWETLGVEGVDYENLYVTYTETIYIACAYTDNHIGIRPQFLTESGGMYSLDDLINSMTHEVRHRYQRINAKNDDLGFPENIKYGWTLPAVDFRNDPTKNYWDYYVSPVEADAKAFAALSQDDD